MADQMLPVARKDEPVLPPPWGTDAATQGQDGRRHWMALGNYSFCDPVAPERRDRAIFA
jgi:hypothetical protein